MGDFYKPGAEFVSKSFLYKNGKIGVRFFNEYADYIDMTYEQLEVNLGNVDEKFSSEIILETSKSYTFYMDRENFLWSYSLSYQKNKLTDIVGYGDAKDENVLELNFGTYTLGLKNRACDKELFQYASAVLYETGLFEALAGIGSEIDTNSPCGCVSFYIKTLNEQIFDEAAINAIIDDTVGRRFGISGQYDKVIDVKYVDVTEPTIILVNFYSDILKYKDRLSLMSIDSQCIDVGKQRVHYTKNGLHGISMSLINNKVAYTCAYKTENLNSRLSDDVALYWGKDMCRQVIVDSTHVDKNTLLVANLYLENFHECVYELGKKFLNDIVESFESELFKETPVIKVKSVRNKILFYKEYSLAEDGLADKIGSAIAVVKPLLNDGFKKVIGPIYGKGSYKNTNHPDMLIATFSSKVNDRIVVGIKLDKRMIIEDEMGFSCLYRILCKQ